MQLIENYYNFEEGSNPHLSSGSGSIHSTASKKAKVINNTGNNSSQVINNYIEKNHLKYILDDLKQLLVSSDIDKSIKAEITVEIDKIEKYDCDVENIEHNTWKSIKSKIENIKDKLTLENAANVTVIAQYLAFIAAPHIDKLFSFIQSIK